MGWTVDDNFSLSEGSFLLTLEGREKNLRLKSLIKKKKLPQGIERSENPTHKAKQTEKTKTNKQLLWFSLPYISFLETSFSPFQQQSTDSCKKSCQLRKMSGLSVLFYPIENLPVRFHGTVIETAAENLMSKQVIPIA
jgi:hypothetical protein